MKNLLSKFTAFLIVLLFGGCSKENNKLPIDSDNTIKMLALNINSETHDADVMLLCDDGSYALYDADNGKGYGMVYVNASLQNEFSEGITILVDKDGKPAMASFDDQHIIFNNVTDDSFDCALINKNGEISYYWDIKVNAALGEKTVTKAIYNPWKEITNFDWTWDEHQKKAIVPFICKMISFGVTGVGVVAAFTASSPVVLIVGGTVAIGSLAYTAYTEANKSGILSNNWLKYSLYPFDVTNDLGINWKKTLPEGKIAFSPKNFILGIFAKTFNERGDQLLEDMGRYEEITEPTFKAKEWQIKLSPPLLECSPEEKTYRISVTTKSTWTIDDSNIDKSWCSVTKDGNSLIVKVKTYNGIESRSCSAIIKTKIFKDEIPPATLWIKQEGVVFELSESSLSFTEKGGSKDVNVRTNDQITSWKVTSKPTWCTIQEGKESFVVSVKEESKPRSGVITVTGTTKSGISIDQTINVKQMFAYTWDGTSWTFTGNVTIQEDDDIDTDFSSFGLTVNNVQNKEFSFSGDFEELQGITKISCDKNGNLVFDMFSSISESGILYQTTFKMVIERIDDEKAVANMTGNTNFGINMKGKYTGIRKNDTN